MSIGKNIKKFRKEKKLTQVELAKKANMSRSYLADVEGDRYNPSIETLSDIANALGVTTGEILEGRDSFGKFIKTRREAEGLSLETVAEKAGINKKHLERIENEETTSFYLDVKTMKKLAEVLNVSYSQIYEAKGSLIDLTDREKKEFLDSLYKEDYINEQVLYTLSLFNFPENKNNELLVEFVDVLSKVVVNSKAKFTFSINLDKQESFNSFREKLINLDNLELKMRIIEALNNLAIKHKLINKINPLPFKTEREFINEIKIDLTDNDVIQKYPIYVDDRPLTEKELRKVIALVRMDREIEQD